MKPGRIIGIPLEEVGPRLKELHNAITEKGMAIGAQTDCRLEITDGKHVNSAIITVYFIQKEEDQTSENLGNSESVKNPEE